jgi:hypothetical protein
MENCDKTKFCEGISLTIKKILGKIGNNIAAFSQ